VSIEFAQDFSYKTMKRPRKAGIMALINLAKHAGGHAKLIKGFTRLSKGMDYGDDIILSIGTIQRAIRAWRMALLRVRPACAHATGFKSRTAQAAVVVRLR
jgi:hypothetical protein